MSELRELETPALLLERAKLDANWQRLSQRIAALGPALRLHVKTAKSLELVRRLHSNAPAPICVSTLKEAEQFLAHGVTDILYAVGIAPGKLDHVLDLRSRGQAAAWYRDHLGA